MVINLSDEPHMPLMFIYPPECILPFILFYSLWYLILGIFYIIHILKNHLPANKKILSMARIITLQEISMPFYWYIYLRRSLEKHELQPLFNLHL